MGTGWKGIEPVFQNLQQAIKYFFELYIFAERKYSSPMKTLFKNTLSIFTFFLLYSGYAQIDVREHVMRNASDNFSFAKPPEVYEGSPYLNDAFEPGFVF